MEVYTRALYDGGLDLGSGAIVMGLLLAAGILGGAIAGTAVGGRQIGFGLAAMMGSFYGALATLPVAVVALVVTVWVL